MRLLAVILVSAMVAVARAAPVELLHNVPSAIAVSSRASDEAYQPERLVDGKPETAWNSATGDLVGAWVEFRVPAEVMVDEIKLIVGFTGPGKEGDLFELNHRIKRVRVLRDNVKLGDFTLDPSSRELQAIAIRTLGGVYRLQVLATVPGKRRAYRETCISEREVWGTVPAPMRPARHEVSGYWHVSVGKLEASKIRFMRAHGPTPTFDERCRLNNCTPADPGISKLVPSGSAFRSVLVETGARGYARIFVETQAGWFMAGTLAMGAYIDATYQAKVERLQIKDEVLEIVIDFTSPIAGDHARLYSVCGIADNAPSCLADAVGLEVKHTKYKVDDRHSAIIAGEYLRVDRVGTARAWEWIIGDHKLVF